MAVTQVPSFWGYLGQGIGQGTEQGFDIYQREKDRRDAEAHRKTAEAMQMLNFWQGMNQSGQLPSADLSARVQAMSPYLPEGMKDIKFGPSIQEQRQDIVNRPAPLIGGGAIPGPMAQLPQGAGVPYAKLKMLGLPTAQEEITSAQGVRRGAQELTQGAQQIALGDESLTPEAKAARNFERQHKILNVISQAYPDQAINQMGGLMKLGPGNIKTTAQKAYDLFKKANPAQAQAVDENIARAAMESAVADRYAQAYGLHSARMAAAYRIQSGQGNQWDKLMDNLQRVVEKIPTDPAELMKLHIGEKGFDLNKIMTEAHTLKAEAIRIQAEIQAGIQGGKLPEGAEKRAGELMQRAAQIFGGPSTPMPQSPVTSGPQNTVGPSFQDRQTQDTINNPAKPDQLPATDSRIDLWASQIKAAHVDPAETINTAANLTEEDRKRLRAKFGIK